MSFESCNGSVHIAELNLGLHKVEIPTHAMGTL